ncbi:MAG: toll/interleukin-1 receptor domain-containing protein [Christensenellaceae bacterium]|jgi:hypothetical protein
MSAEMTRRSLNQLDNDIAALEKKSAELGRKEAAARGNVSRTMKGIPKNASATTLRSKQSQIDRYNSEANKAARDKADIDIKIADKRKKRNETVLKLQKEESEERKKEDKAQIAIQQEYERRIDELISQLSRTVSTTHVGQKNLYAEQGNEKYDVFISYASEDRGVADDLCAALQKKGVAVWFDSINIGWGDSLRAKIDEGLIKSRFGIVILSNDYIKKGWTQYELDGLFQKEMTRGKTILPIWHNISKDEVHAFSPTLAGRKALPTALLSAREIADELTKLLPLYKVSEELNGMEESPNE